VLGPVLHGEKIALEPLRFEDIDLFRSWLADLEVSRYLLARFVPSHKEEEAWYDNAVRNDSLVIWGIVADGKTIGDTSINGIDWVNRHAATGTIIGNKTAWGRGYASEAVRLRTEYAFEELGLERLETECFAENIPMHRVLDKAGYQRIARRRRHLYKGGAWHDTLLFELLREDWLARRC
jgi:RimJ/RimL family protein N-acetyltransferase